MKNIRNFSIIAHIDHGKSTLADRLLEATNTIPKRKMRDQVLDSMELEREKGITIKMQPVRMMYKSNSHPANSPNPEYILNLIDTPGHIDFSYEVSRALKAVEGSLLLVDATQGVQAQTLSVLDMAHEYDLKIIPVVTKIDSSLAKISETKKEIVALLNCEEADIVETSGKTGVGVETLLREIVERIPPPKEEFAGRPGFRALIFDFQYSDHRGVVVYVRVLDGEITKNTALKFSASGKKFSAGEIGIFSPDETPKDSLGAGEIGYIVTGIKEPGIAFVGDTISSVLNPLPQVEGYRTPAPIVWASIYPESQDDFPHLRSALGRLRLSDAAFSFEEETSGALGRGFRAGFLGMLHLEIITERLKREFNLSLIVTTPSITYEAHYSNGLVEKIYSPHLFPEESSRAQIFEPIIKAKVIFPSKYLGEIIKITHGHEGEVGATESFGRDRVSLEITMPLRELMRNFFDEVKSVTAGYGSVSYEAGELRPADVVKLEILIADEPVPAFCRVVSRKRLDLEAETTVEKLNSILPRQLFTVKIQAKALGRILASRTLSALKKNVTAHLYGGDITRKRKLWEKQKKGKKRMKAAGSVDIPHDVFLKMMRPEN